MFVFKTLPAFVWPRLKKAAPVVARPHAACAASRLALTDVRLASLSIVLDQAVSHEDLGVSVKGGGREH